MRFIGFIGPSYTLRSRNVDCQRCINLYPELNEIGTGKEKEVASLVATPGLQLLATYGSGPVRGLYTASNGMLFVVSGNKFYAVSSIWTAVQLGTLNTSSGPVSMVDNGLQLVVVDGLYGYRLAMDTSTFAQILDPDFVGADQVTYQDGYFIFNKPNSQFFYHSDLNSTDIDALDFHAVEGNPDNVVAVVSDHRELWVFGETTTEVFFNSGEADSVFQRIQGAFIEHGCAAAFSVVKMNNTTFWVGKDDQGGGLVYMAQGYQPQRISTLAVETAIQSYGDISTARGYSYQENGHNFYVLNFPTARTTWVFDTSTNLWHERCYNNQGTLERHRADCHAYAYATHVVGDYESGKVYALSQSTYTDNGVEIMRRRVAPHISEGLTRIPFHSFQLDIEAGTGLDGVGQGTDPQVILRWSDDGGHTWSNEKWTSFGKIGQRKKRAIWRRLGQSRDRVFEVTTSEPVKVVFIGAEINGAG
jgi:Phage stabilisation protein